MKEKIKKFIKSFFTILVSWLGVFIVLYVVIEIFFLNIIIKNLPASYQIAFGLEGYVLTQYSKDDLVPKNYIAILGDSYAYGTGEWMSSVIRQVQPDYNAAHIIHKKLGRDVVTFGIPGAGSMRSMLSLSGFFLGSAREFYRYHAIPDPELLVAYFYEGNDLSDNLKELNDYYIERGYKPDLLYDPVYFNQFLDKEVVAKDSSLGEVKKLSFVDNLLLGRLMIFGLGDVYSRWFNPKPEKSAADMNWPTTKDNIALINGAGVEMGAGLQSPALELNDSDTQKAFYVFKRALEKLHKVYPDSKIMVVYIPSNLSSYKWLSKTVQGTDKDFHPAYYNSAAIDKRSNYLCSQAESIVKAQGFGFLDIRGRIREETKLHRIHHPWDWMHFDRRGYQALGEEISRYIAWQAQADPAKVFPASTCAVLE